MEAVGVSPITVTAFSSPSATSLLYPGGTGDAVVLIGNQNPFAVTLSAFGLPSQATFADGYADSRLQTPKTGCDPSNSEVGWTGSTAASGSMHLLVVPITVGPKSNLAVTLTGEATMTESSPPACQGTYFLMPSFTGVRAQQAASGAVPGPTTDTWTLSPSNTNGLPPPPETPNPPTIPNLLGPSLGAPPSSVPYTVPPERLGHAVHGVRRGSVPTHSDEGASSIRIPPSWIDRIIKAVTRYAVAVGAASGIGVSVLPLLIIFLLVQRRLDARDPKLALAPAHAEPDLGYVDRSRLT